jgi:hypothetical protein
MQPTPLMTNRWEGFVPASPTDNGVTYRYKFDYLYNVFGKEPQHDSAYSPAYNLQINQQ